MYDGDVFDTEKYEGCYRRSAKLADDLSNIDDVLPVHKRMYAAGNCKLPPSPIPLVGAILCPLPSLVTPGINLACKQKSWPSGRSCARTPSAPGTPTRRAYSSSASPHSCAKGWELNAQSTAPGRSVRYTAGSPLGASGRSKPLALVVYNPQP